MACLLPIGQPPGHTSTRPHSIKSLSFSLSRPGPGQGRAANRLGCMCQLTLHGNTRPPILVATVHTVPSSSPRDPLARRAQRGLSRPLSNGARQWRCLWATGYGPWAVAHGTWHDVPLSPNHRHHPCAPPSLPFPTRSQVESTASHDHLNVSIRPDFRAEEAAVEHWYRAYWKAKRLPA